MSDVEVWAVVSQELLKWAMLLLATRTLAPISSHFRWLLEREKRSDELFLKQCGDALRIIKRLKRRLDHGDIINVDDVRGELEEFTSEV